VGKNNFLRRWDVVDFIYRVNRFLLKANELYGTSSVAELCVFINFVNLHIFEGSFTYDNWTYYNVIHIATESLHNLFLNKIVELWERNEIKGNW
jgi:hypothetical protein